MSAERYRPIRDYALIGDMRTAALVGSNGSIDWCCWPRFDSAAVFCSLLDSRRGGSFRIAPASGYESARSYAVGTNVLTTTFRTDGGAMKLTDLMPVGTGGQAILRLVEGVAGEVDVELRFRPTFDYARAMTAVEPRSHGAVARGEATRLRLACPFPLRSDGGGGVSGRIRLRAGTRYWIRLEAGDEGPENDPDESLAGTLRYWRAWSRACAYEGPYSDLVRRSALVLKGLTFEPSGALVAAPTTSLPEEIGGVRNWDYRYTWLRDSALVLAALMALGYHDEADAFFDWLERLCVRCHDRLQIVYGIDGRTQLPEQALDHLEGYRGSKPVRVGNAAAGQAQLDVPGELLDAAYVCYGSMRRPFGREFAGVLSALADQAAARWREPDQGIWEVRTGPRHFLHSKLLCWVALDRAVRLADAGALSGNRETWRTEREGIRDTILGRGYDPRLGAFSQVLGTPALDASALVIPLVGFLPATDPRIRSTLERIRERLTAHGLAYRSLADDGLPGGEGTFALCSFWLVDNLALQGRIEEARELFERVAGYANDVGLLAEQIDPRTGDLLGNHPQGYSHLALIRSALAIARAQASESSRPESRQRSEREIG